MKSTKKKLINFALVLGSLAVVLSVGFKGVDPNELLQTLRNGIPVWIAACFLCYALYTLCDTQCISRYLKKQGCKITFSQALFVSIEGTYYSGITPGSTGGQPMQVYFLHKWGVPIGVSSSALLVKQFCYQLMMVLVDILLFIHRQDFLNDTLGGNRWILIVGFLYNSFVVSLLILAALNRTLLWRLLKFFIRVGAKLRLIKDTGATEVKWADMMDSYHNSIQSFIHHPLQLLEQLFLSAVQLFAYLAVTVFAFRALGQNTPPFFETLALSAMLFTSANYTPLPGASGAQEGFFSLFFAPVVSETVRFPALLLWRFFTYYLGPIVGAIASVVHGAKKHSTEQEA